MSNVVYRLLDQDTVVIGGICFREEAGRREAYVVGAANGYVVEVSKPIHSLNNGLFCVDGVETTDNSMYLILRELCIGVLDESGNVGKNCDCAGA